MIAETVSVGTELLLGQIVDTDAVYLAQMLSRLGITSTSAPRSATTRSV